MQLSQSDFTTDFKLANQHLRAEQYQKAIVFYHYALQHTQDNSALYENLGDALHASQQYTEAETAYRQALALSPNSPYVLAQLGRIHFQQQRYQPAITAYRQAITLQPICIPYSYDLAQVLLATDKPTEAAKVYKRLGAVLKQDGQIEGAIAAYQKAIDLQPDSPDLHQAIGECQHLNGSYSTAASHYQKVAQLAQSPQHLWFYKNWGEALLMTQSA